MVSRTTLAVLFWVATLLSSFDAYACSCAPAPENTPQEIERRLGEYEVVFIGEVLTVEQQRVRWTLKREANLDHVFEEAVFVVMETFKGPYQPGDMVRVRTEFTPSNCGRTIRNDPVWVEQVIDLGGGREGVAPAQISNAWLIYTGGTEPYDLGASCQDTGSRP